MNGTPEPGCLIDAERAGGEKTSSVAEREVPTVGVVGFERALGRLRRTLREGLPAWLSPEGSLRSGDDVWPRRGTDDERELAGLRFSEGFSREGCTLLEGGGREMALSVGKREWTARLDEGSPGERSESCMSDVEAVEVCMAGLLIRRFRSKWPPALTDEMELLCGLTAPNDRDEWSVWEDEGTGLGV